MYGSPLIQLKSKLSLWMFSSVARNLCFRSTSLDGIWKQIMFLKVHSETLRIEEERKSRSGLVYTTSPGFQDVSERKIRFTSTYSPKDLLEKIEYIVKEMGLRVLKKNGKLRVKQEGKVQKCLGSLSVAAEVFEISPSLFVVELRKSYGDSILYRKLCTKLSSDLGASRSSPELLSTQA